MIDKLLEYIFPSRCIFCGRLGSTPCVECEKEIKKIEGRVCLKCGVPIGDIVYNYCSYCINKKTYYDKIIPVFYYDKKVKKGIRLFKYHGFYQSAEKFSEFMKEAIEKSDIIYDIIVPVPISRKRFLKRGYNHSELLAMKLSKLLKTRYVNVLIRTKDTKPFYKLKKEQREKEIRNSIVINKRYIDLIKDKNVLLIDDIFTTGATLNECSRILKENGAQKVFAAVIAIAKYR
ncbi:ComF family protein [Caldicellulosiruptoraceae bacterium PP1]